MPGKLEATILSMSASLEDKMGIMDHKLDLILSQLSGCAGQTSESQMVVSASSPGPCDAPGKDALAAAAEFFDIASIANSEVEVQAVGAPPSSTATEQESPEPLPSCEDSNLCLASTSDGVSKSDGTARQLFQKNADCNSTDDATPSLRGGWSSPGAPAGIDGASQLSAAHVKLANVITALKSKLLLSEHLQVPLTSAIPVPRDESKVSRAQTPSPSSDPGDSIGSEERPVPRVESKISWAQTPSPRSDAGDSIVSDELPVSSCEELPSDVDDDEELPALVPVATAGTLPDEENILAAVESADCSSIAAALAAAISFGGRLATEGERSGFRARLEAAVSESSAYTEIEKCQSEARRSSCDHTYSFEKRSSYKQDVFCDECGGGIPWKSKFRLCQHCGRTMCHHCHVNHDQQGFRLP